MLASADFTTPLSHDSMHVHTQVDTGMLNSVHGHLYVCCLGEHRDKNLFGSRHVDTEDHRDGLFCDVTQTCQQYTITSTAHVKMIFFAFHKTFT